tara:strand:- start:9630 stop:11591 length:1962 start_codon:yes stop_codon:yes gene_type:complete
MAKGFNIAEMFGQLPDMVMQGFSDPASILSIAETGQPPKPEEIKLPDNIPTTDSIFNSVFEATGDTMLADMAASGTASDELVQAMLTDLAPSQDQMQLELAANAVLQSTGYTTGNINNLEIDEEEIFEAYANSYGVDQNSLKNTVTRLARQNEIDGKTWWHGEDGDRTFEPTPFFVDPNKALQEVVGDVNTTLESEDFTEGFNEIPWSWNAADSLRSDTGSGLLNVAKAAKEFFVQGLTGQGKAAAAELEARGLSTPQTHDIGSVWNTDSPDPLANVVATPTPTPEVDINDDNVTSSLIENIKELEETVPTPTPITDPTPTPKVVETPVIQEAGSPVEFGTEKYNKVIRDITANNFGMYIEDATGISEDGLRVYMFVDPNTQNVYRHSPAPVGSSGYDLLWDLGKMTLEKTPKEGEVFHVYKLGNETYHYNKLYDRWNKPRDPSAIPSLSSIASSMPDDSTAHLFGKTPTEQWDILKAQQMGDQAYNPVMWGARRYGLRPAFGEFLLGGGLVDGKMRPFHEWLPTQGDRDTSQDWATLVKASQMSADPSSYLGYDSTNPENLRLLAMQSLMQGDAAKTNILNMASTALGAGEGYASDSLRSHLSSLYDIYEAQVGAKGKPVGGFASWLGERRIVDTPTKEPQAPEAGGAGGYD